jgi:putative endonuclease
LSESLPQPGHFISLELPSSGLRGGNGNSISPPRSYGFVVGQGGWTVYVLRCRTGELYTGCTTDMERRLREHNSGRGARFTRGRRPVTLVYREGAETRAEALRRELAIKRLSRAGKLALVRSPGPPRRRPGS